MCFIHLFINGHLDAFHVFTAVNNAVMNIEVPISFNILLSFPSISYSEVGLLYHMVVLICFRNCHTILHDDHTNLDVHQKVHKGSLFKNTCVLMITILAVVRFCLIVVLICTYLIWFVFVFTSLIIISWTFSYTCWPLRCHLWKNVYSTLRLPNKLVASLFKSFIL